MKNLPLQGLCRCRRGAGGTPALLDGAGETPAFLSDSVDGRGRSSYAYSMTTQKDFQQLAESETQQSLVAEFIGFLRTNKKWWLAPILLILLAFGALLLLSTTAAAPFIYTLF